jgi:hypothetical protein
MLGAGESRRESLAYILAAVNQLAGPFFLRENGPSLTANR